MATRAVQTVITFSAWDTLNQVGKTGDVANFTLRWVKDGMSGATSNAASELDATNSPGEYKITMTSSETDCLFGELNGKSSTANIIIIPTRIGFDLVANDIADALLDRSNAVETGLTPRGLMRLLGAVMVGKLSGAATATNTFRNAVADSKDRVTATVDADGNRSAITTDAT